MKMQTLALLAVPAASLLSTPAAFATDRKAIDNLKEAYFEVAGYPADVYAAEYPDPQSAPAKEGLAGIVDELGAGVQAAIKAAGVTTCATMPTSGSQAVSVTLKGTAFPSTVTFMAPSMIIPVGMTGAGKKFAAAAGITTQISPDFIFQGHVEWSCDNPVGVAVLQNPGPTLKGTTQTINVYVDHTTPTADMIEFSQVVNDTATPTTLWDAQIERLVKDNGTGEFKLYDAKIFNRGGGVTNNVYDGVGGTFYTEQMQIAGNPGSAKFSAWRKTSVTAGNNLSALSGSVAKPTATGTATADFTVAEPFGTGVDIRGCVDGSASDATAAADCDGHLLDDAPPNAAAGGLAFTISSLKALGASIATVP